jgi:tetratricopeptide (TPR) repeat protein
MRDLRALRMIRVFVAREISTERYAQEMASVLAKYPDDPSLALIAVNEAALRKDYPATIRQIDVLDKAIGGDAFQDAVRASIYVQSGDFQQARAHAEAAVKVEPTLVRAQFSLIEAEAALHDNAAVLASLRTLANLGQMLSASALAPLPHYTEFAKSPEFQTWAAEHP